MNRETNLEWESRRLAIWLGFLFILLIAGGQLLIAARMIQTFDWSNPWHYLLSSGFAILMAFIVAQVRNFIRLAVHLEIVDGELRARGLFGQRWRIPLTEIEAFREANIYRRDRIQPVLQVGVIAGGMRSFVEALQKNAPNMKVVETERLKKQGRW